ncbi:MAG: hypothetical protein IPM06_18720 [Rhizobiales bacterium]|nr:hypothetical protein [Hyphomicrobiales bacterium]
MDVKIESVWVSGGAVRVTAMLNDQPCNGAFALLKGSARQRLLDEATILAGRANVLMARADVLRMAASENIIINEENDNAKNP